MRTIIFYLALTATLAAAPLPMAEQHRLAVYCAYTVATHENIIGPDGGGGATYKAGDTCPECRGAGEVGDGVVMMKCIYNEDGLYCNKGKLAAAGSADFGSSSCGCNCECECEGKCGGDCDCKNCVCTKEEEPLNESQIRRLGEILVKAMKEAREKREASDPDTPQEPTESKQPQAQEEKPLTELRQSNWNWEGRSNPPLAVKRQHLIEDHQIDPDSVNKMTNSEIEALHNLLHNSEVRSSAPKSKSSSSSRSSSSSCPSGNCPTSSSSSSRSRYRLFRR